MTVAALYFNKDFKKSPNYTYLLVLQKRFYLIGFTTGFHARNGVLLKLLQFHYFTGLSLAAPSNPGNLIFAYGRPENVNFFQKNCVLAPWIWTAMFYDIACHTVRASKILLKKKASNEQPRAMKK